MLSIRMLCYYAECRTLFTSMLNVIMLGDVMLSVVMLSVVTLSVAVPIIGLRTEICLMLD